MLVKISTLCFKGEKFESGHRSADVTEEEVDRKQISKAAKWKSLAFRQNVCSLRTSILPQSRLKTRSAVLAVSCQGSVWRLAGLPLDCVSTAVGKGYRDIHSDSVVLTDYSSYCAGLCDSPTVSASVPYACLSLCNLFLVPVSESPLWVWLGWAMMTQGGPP